MKTEKDISELLKNLDSEDAKLNLDLEPDFFNENAKQLKQIPNKGSSTKIRSMITMAAVAASLLLGLFISYPFQETDEGEWLYAYLDQEGIEDFEEEILFEYYDFSSEEDPEENELLLEYETHTLLEVLIEE